MPDAVAVELHRVNVIGSDALSGRRNRPALTRVRMLMIDVDSELSYRQFRKKTYFVIVPVSQPPFRFTTTKARMQF